MAKKQVLVSICDTCGKEVTTDFKPVAHRAEFELPDKWLHIQANSRTKEVFARDLCDECSKPILKAVGNYGNGK